MVTSDGLPVHCGGEAPGYQSYIQCDKYNPTTNSWDYIGDMSVKRQHPCGGNIDETRFIVLGKFILLYHAHCNVRQLYLPLTIKVEKISGLELLIPLLMFMMEMASTLDLITLFKWMFAVRQRCLPTK